MLRKQHKKNDKSSARKLTFIKETSNSEKCRKPENSIDELLAPQTKLFKPAIVI